MVSEKQPHYPYISQVEFLTCKWRFDRVPYTFHKHRQWKPGTISYITIKRDVCGNYWLCITTTYTDFKPLPTTGKSVGADFGMKDAYLTLSTGEKHPTPTTLGQETILEQTSESQQRTFSGKVTKKPCSATTNAVGGGVSGNSHVNVYRKITN